MNNAQTMGVLLLARWQDGALAAALTDELMEMNGWEREKADTEVAQIIKTGREAHYLAQAALLMAEGSEESETIRWAILDKANVAVDRGYSVILVTGDEPARALIDAPREPHNFWGDTVVVVGAEWVLEEVEAMKDATRNDKAEEWPPEWNV